MTESFFTKQELEVYNFDTKVTSHHKVMFKTPITRKNFRLAYISKDNPANILISGISFTKTPPEFQIYILRKAMNDPTRQTNYGFHFEKIWAHEAQLFSQPFSDDFTFHQASNGETYFLGPANKSSLKLFMLKMEDFLLQYNLGGGGGLFGGGGAGGRPAGLSMTEKQFTKYAQYGQFPGRSLMGHYSMMNLDGKLYVFGGETGDNEVLSELWQFDTKTEKWTDLSPKNGDLLRRTGAVMDGFGKRLLICGGRDSKKALCNSAIIYNIENDVWKIFKLEPSSEPVHSCFLIESKLLVARGRRIDVATEDESKLYFEMSGGHNKETQDNTLQDYRKLFAEMPYHDLVFKVENQEIPAHRALLSIRCPHFLKVFPADMRDPSNKVIEVPDIRADVFKGLLEYLYCGEIPQDENVVAELLKASEVYQIEELRAKCQDYLAFNLRIDNVAKIATLARSNKADQLKTAVLKFIKANESKFDVGDFNQFDKDFLIEILMYK